MNGVTGTYLLAILLGLLVGLGLWFLMWLRSRVSKRQYHRLTTSENFTLLLEHLIEGDLPSAHKILGDIVHDDQVPVEVHFAFAALSHKMGQLERSVRTYRSILARTRLSRGRFHEAQVRLARCLAELGRAEEADAIIETLPRRFKARAEILETQRSVADQSRKWNEALSASEGLEKVEGEEPIDDADLIAQMAGEAAAQGNIEVAFKGYRRALRLRPESLQARLGLSQLYLHHGKAGKAKRHLLAALQQYPSLAPLLLPRVHSAISSDGPVETERFEELLSELDGLPGVGLWARLEQADHLFQKGEFELCRALLEELLKDHPRSVEAHEAYLNLLLEVDDIQSLRRAIDRFIDLAAEEIKRFHCLRCNYSSSSPFIECPGCGHTGTLSYDP